MKVIYNNRTGCFKICEDKTKSTEDVLGHSPTQQNGYVCNSGICTPGGLLTKAECESYCNSSSGN